MGRWPGSGKTTVEECLFISIFRLSRGGWLNGFKRGSISWTRPSGNVSEIGMAINIDEKNLTKNLMLLFYTHTDGNTGEETKMEYKVDISTTPCYFNGVRYWFICRFCGKRVGKLYLPSGGKYFGCRQCYNLTYRSCQEHSKKLDFFMRHPDLLTAHLKSRDPKVFCSALLAYAKIMEKL